MASYDSDDEPLAILAAGKKENPERFGDILVNESNGRCDGQPKKKKSKKNKDIKFKIPPLTIRFSRQVKRVSPVVVHRPDEVWLYLKDFNQVGPFNCLLCSEWFVNRPKIVIHYILNHKKDFCGICSFFVTDREAWQEHIKLHIPLPCSQCSEAFPNESVLREHFSTVHKLVHCRLCHLRLTEGEQHHAHLLQKHYVTNVSVINDSVFWEVEVDTSQHFTCLLCDKSNIPSLGFVGHYLGNHRFTLKCLTILLSGKDIPFMVFGADIRPEFIESLKDQGRWGYTDLDLSPHGIGLDTHITRQEDNVLNNLKVDIKEEVVSDHEGVKNYGGVKDVKDNNDEKDKKKEVKEEQEQEWDEIKSYRGIEDFDVTLMELIVLEKPYFEYINRSLSDLNSNIVTEISEITYEKMKANSLDAIICELCSEKFFNINEFSSHMYKLHSVKTLPIYSCRVCATTFNSLNELSGHITEELSGFEDLWLCQFCDLEFDDRPSTRRHLTEHLDIMDGDNCFSPHLGFKCRHCPMLFWDERHREQHQVRVHSQNHIAEFYKCICNEVFSDKIWFTYHYQHKHSKELPYLVKCCICATVLSSVSDMRAHFEKQHPAAKKVFCSLDGCSYRPLSHRKSFALHLRTQHTKNGESRNKCGVCGRSFATQRARTSHAVQAHGGGRFRCKLCGQMLHTMDERKLHYMVHHPGQNPYVCNICGKSFQYKSSLYIHKQEHAPKKQSYTCSYCQKVFAKKDSFREHVQIHEGPRHACSYCPMRFVQRSNMLRHERRHTGERPYACPHCHKSFADKGACNAHTRSHFKEHCFACLYCGQTFVQKSKLTYHVRKHTGEDLETCPVCSKLFTSVCSLRQHMKSHEEKPKLPTISCPLCDKKYREERNMLRHLRASHTGEPMTCPLCPKQFTDSVGMRHHVLTHARANIYRCKLCPKSYAVKRSMNSHLYKRHNLKRGNVSLKEYYIRLDPRECKLDLDEDTMTSIFGPPRKRADIAMKSIAAITEDKKIKKHKLPKPDEESDEKTSEEDDDENDQDEEKDSEEDDANKNAEETAEEEPLAKPDFVLVKIEPIEHDEDYS